MTRSQAMMRLTLVLMTPMGSALACRTEWLQSERRYVYVLDAHSGAVVQKLGVLENVCPSKSWAPHWRPGDRCDAPGQVVGAATDPRVEGGLFLVDTNTGSSTFQFE